MKLTTSFTTLAITAAFATATENDAPKVMPKLIGADQLMDIAVEGSDNPDYCNRPTQPDYYCYKTGYPKCCTKTKGNCPTNEANKPGCECDGGNRNCNPNNDVKDTRCLLGDNDCAGNEYCAVNEGECMLRIAEIYGRCQPLPEICTFEFEPVCGCDNETYSNKCAAASVGVNVASKGECTRTECTYYGTDDDNCSGDEFCSIGEGKCNLRARTQQGVCLEQPAVCNLNYDPVCGCDGVDYANDCTASAAGVNIRKTGSC